MSKFTPGPWRACGGFTPAYGAVHSAAGYIVFGMADSKFHLEHGKPIKAPGLDEQFQNRRLIASSPDLYNLATRLAALKDGLANGNSSAEAAATELAFLASELIARVDGEKVAS